MLFRHRSLANDNAGEEERLVGEIGNIVGLVDPRIGHQTVCVGSNGGLDVVFGSIKNSGESEGGGDVLWADEEGVVVCIRVFGDGVEGEVQTGFVPHGWGFEGVE